MGWGVWLDEIVVNGILDLNAVFVQSDSSKLYDLVLASAATSSL